MDEVLGGEAGVVQWNAIAPLALYGEAHRGLQARDRAAVGRVPIAGERELPRLRLEDVLGIAPRNRRPEGHVAVVARRVVHAVVLHDPLQRVPGVGLEGDCRVQPLRLEAGRNLSSQVAARHQITGREQRSAERYAPVSQDGAARNPRPVRVVGGRESAREPYAAPAQEGVCLGDDVHDSTLGIRAVQYRGRAADYLDAVYRGRIDGGQVLAGAVPVGGVVHGDAVHQQHHLVADQPADDDRALAGGGHLHLNSGHVPQEVRSLHSGADLAQAGLYVGDGGRLIEAAHFGGAGTGHHQGVHLHGIAHRGRVLLRDGKYGGDGE